MASDLITDLASDVFENLDHLEDLTYSPIAGASSSVRGYISKAIRRVGFESALNEQHDEFSFLKSAIVSPRRTDKITDNVDHWEFISPIIDDGVTATWLITKL